MIKSNKIKRGKHFEAHRQRAGAGAVWQRARLGAAGADAGSAGGRRTGRGEAGAGAGARHRARRCARCAPRRHGGPKPAPTQEAQPGIAPGVVPGARPGGMEAGPPLGKSSGLHPRRRGDPGRQRGRQVLAGRHYQQPRLAVRSAQGADHLAGAGLGRTADRRHQGVRSGDPRPDGGPRKPPRLLRGCREGDQGVRRRGAGGRARQEAHRAVRQRAEPDQHRPSVRDGEGRGFPEAPEGARGGARARGPEARREGHRGDRRAAADRDQAHARAAGVQLERPHLPGAPAEPDDGVRDPGAHRAAGLSKSAA